jgi:hypothetical protein
VTVADFKADRTAETPAQQGFAVLKLPESFRAVYPFVTLGGASSGTVMTRNRRSSAA